MIYMYYGPETHYHKINVAVCFMGAWKNTRIQMKIKIINNEFVSYIFSFTIKIMYNSCKVKTINSQQQQQQQQQFILYLQVTLKV